MDPLSSANTSVGQIRSARPPATSVETTSSSVQIEHGVLDCWHLPRPVAAQTTDIPFVEEAALRAFVLQRSTWSACFAETSEPGASWLQRSCRWLGRSILAAIDIAANRVVWACFDPVKLEAAYESYHLILVFDKLSTAVGQDKDIEASAGLRRDFYSGKERFRRLGLIELFEKTVERLDQIESDASQLANQSFRSVPHAS